jgi:hypothetical protein
VSVAYLLGLAPQFYPKILQDTEKPCSQTETYLKGTINSLIGRVRSQEGPQWAEPSIDSEGKTGRGYAGAEKLHRAPPVHFELVGWKCNALEELHHHDRF